MQYKKTTIAATVALSATVLSAYVPSEPWTTLTPTATYPGGISEYTTSFGIAVNPITTSIASTATAASSSAAGNKRRDAISQIGDGQIQATTATSSTTSATKTEAAAISQIGDGQIQATTATSSTTSATKTEAAAISQIGDGQIQATTATSSATKTEAAAISQIGDGQIQATTATSSATKTEAAAISQIGDGQIQATTATKSEATAISQIGDGQIQATTATKTGASQISDGQVQATTGSASATATSTSTAGTTDSSDPVTAESCDSKGTLSLVLKDGVLTDSKGRIGSIVANRQFQFDGPPPQAGAIYAKGWSITPEGNLALGDDDVFYQCLSGDFYNLYDEKIGAQCSPINLEVVDLVSC